MDKIFNKPFAVNGARVTIPENGTENERVSFDKGFTEPYEVEAPSVDNPNGQGFNILRPEMNEALYQLSSACNVLAENIDKWISLTTENLNNITQKGRYFQAVQSQATNANNYPTNEMGYLLVFDSINNNVTQFYKSAVTSKTFYRYKINSVWGAWVENLTTDNAYTKSEVYTKTEVETAISRLVQFGAGNNSTFTNYYNKQNIVVAGFGRVVAMQQPQGQVDIQIVCKTTGEQSNTMRFYTNGGATDATAFYMASFSTNGNRNLEFEIRVFSGVGVIDNAMFLAQFY